jgi:hypothetical protein
LHAIVAPIIYNKVTQAIKHDAPWSLELAIAFTKAADFA